MRKQFAYSLMVAAAMPGVANADPVNVNLPSAQQLSSDNWLGNPTVSEGTVLVAEGASITQNIGTLKPGKYILSIANLVSTDCALEVTFAGTTKEIPAASTTATLEFELAVEQNVEISIASAEDKSFQVTDVTLKLNYDFEASYNYFNDALIKVSSLISQITSGYGENIEGQTELLARAEAIQKKIYEIKAANDNPDAAGNYTDVYVKYALYGNDATNALMGEINDLKADGAQAVNAWYVADLRAKLSAVYDGESDDVKKIVESIYDGIVRDINLFESDIIVDDKAYKALCDRIDNGDDTDITDLKDKIRTANQTAADNDSAYNDVKDYINGENAYATQWPQSDGLTYGSAYAIYTDVNSQLQDLLANDRYKNILAAAQKELSLAMQKVTQAEKDNEAFHDAIKSVENQTRLKANVDAAVAEMQSVLGKYSTTRAQLDAADAQYETISSDLASKKGNHPDVLTVSQVASKLATAEAAVQAVKDAIEAANVTTAQGVISDTMAALDLTSLVAAANTAINDFDNTARPYTQRVNNIAYANQLLEQLDEDWAQTQSDVANYKYDDELVKDYFTATINSINTAISNLKNAAQNAEDSGKTDITKHNSTFYSTTLPSTLSTINAARNKYKAEAKAARDNFDLVVNDATTGLKKMQEDLDAANEKVKDLAIYEDISYNYKDSIAAIQSKIDDVWAQIAAAKAKTDYAHATAMKAVAMDASIATDIAAINANYEADNATLEAALKAAMLAATSESYNKLVDDINSVNGDATKYGLSFDAIKKAKDDIVTEEASTLYGLDKTAAQTAINAANAEELADIQSKIANIRSKLDELLTVAQQAENKVNANNTVQAALEQAIYDAAPGTGAAGNLDKYYADNITNDALVNNATALADGTVTPVKNVNKEMKTTLVNDIQKLKDDITADRANEELDQKQAEYEQRIAALKTRIDNAKANAEACTANYDKYQEYVTATTGKFDVTQKALDDAIAAANTADAANADYKDQAIVKAQQTNINNAKSNAKKYYKNGTMVSNASKVDALLTTVSDFAAGLEAKATANKTSYDALVAEWTAVKTLWTTVSTNIAKYDESSAREGFQQQLKAQLDLLNQNKTDFEANYAAIGLPNNDRIQELADIKAAINAIEAESLDPENYSARIEADNTNMLAVIKAAVDVAAREYDLDTDTLKMFKNPTSTVLSSSLATVQSEYDKFNDALYKYDIIGTATEKSTFVEVVNNKYLNAVAERGNTVSPDVFDKDSAYVNDIRTDIKNLIGARESFMTAIRAAIAAETAAQISGFETQINKAIAELKALNGYKAKITDAEAKKAVEAQTNKLVAAKDAVAAGLIPEIDAAFAALDNLDDQLVAAKFAAMCTKLDADIALAEAYVEKGKQYLADDSENLSAFESEAASNVGRARREYNSRVKAGSLTDSQFNNIQNRLVNFKDGGNNIYETIKANNEAWPRIQDYTAQAKDAIAAAVEAIKEYVVAGQIQQNYLDGYLSQVNGWYDTYKPMYDQGNLTKGDANYVESWLSGIKSYINSDTAQDNNTSALYKAEKAALQTNIEELEAEYNKYAATDLVDISDAEAAKAIIEGIKADFNNSATSNTAAKLLAIQKRIADEMTLLLEANYQAGVANTAALTELTNELNAVKGTFNAADYTEEELSYADFTPYGGTNEDLSDEIEQLNAAIAAIEQEMADKADQLAYYQDNISDKIAAAQKMANDIKAQAEANKNNIQYVNKQTEMAYKNLLEDGTPSIKSINDAIDSAEEELDNNTTTKTAQAAAFVNKLTQLRNKVNGLQDDIEEAKENGVKEYDWTFYGDLKPQVSDLSVEVTEALYDIKNTAANRELNAQAAELQAQLDAISYDADNYTLADWKVMDGMKKAIEEAINGKADGSVKGLVQEIEDAKMQDYVLDTSGNPIDPTTSAAVITSYEYLMQNGKNAASSTAKVQKIQSDIDDLNEFINTLKIEEEPAVVPGDITGTGEVGDADFDKFLEDLLNGNLPAASDPMFGAYDANGDGNVNIADLQAILNLSNGLNWDGSQAGARAFDMSFEDSSMSIDNSKMINGNTRLVVKLNSSTDFRAFQMDVILPAGMSIAAATADGVTVRTNDLGGKTRIVGYGKLNSDMLALELIGNGNVQFTNVVLTTANAKAVNFELGGTTGISTMAVEQNEGNVVYDFGGKVMNGIKKGIRIIRGKDGSSKKVVK